MFTKEGERGPTGDHGQTGDTGATGATGERGQRGRSAPRRGLIGYLILSLFVLYALWGGYQADQHAQEAIQVNCKFGNENRRVIRLILADSNRRLQTSKQRTEEEKRIGRKIYEGYLKELKPFNCRALR